MKLEYLKDFVIRTSLFNQELFYDLVKNETIPDKALKDILKKTDFKGALFLASPELYEELLKWEKGKIDEEKKIEKLKKSLFKYITRICTRSTPYGLFSTVGVGKIKKNAETKFLIDSYNRHNRLNLELILKIISKIESNPNYALLLKYNINSTIYIAKNKVRFYERKNKKINAIEIDSNEVILKIIDNNINNITIKELIKNLQEIFTDYEPEIIEGYVKELVENQILISELNLNIEEDPLKKIVQFLKTHNLNDAFTEVILKIEKILNQTIFETDELLFHNEIYKLLDSINISYNKKNIIYTDTYSSYSEYSLNESIVNNLKEFLLLTNNLNRKPEYNLESLKTNINTVYGENEVSVYKLLSNEYNLKYKPFGDLNPILNKVNFNNQNYATNNSTTLSTEDKYFLQKTISSKKATINLKKEDFEQINYNDSSIVDTFSVISESIIDNNEEKLVFNYTSGKSAIDILSRFSFHEKIIEIIAEISKYEEEKNTNYICADFCHIPLNIDKSYIIFRKPIKKNKIQYLNNSVEKNSILIKDLVVKIENERIVLFSKKLKKNIIPYIPNAHNTTLFDNLPFYQLIADINQYKRNGMSFSLTNILRVLGHLPRFEYKNIIVSKEAWLLNKKDIAFLSKISSNNLKNNKQLLDFMERKNLTEYAVAEEGDNKFVFSFFNQLSFECFIDIIKNKEEIIVTENFFKSNIVSKQGTHRNEIIIPFLFNK